MNQADGMKDEDERAIVLSPNGCRFRFELAPALRLPRAEQLVLSPEHRRALGIALDARNSVWRCHDELIPQHGLASLAAHPLIAFGEQPGHNLVIGTNADNDRGKG